MTRFWILMVSALVLVFSARAQTNQSRNSSTDLSIARNWTSLTLQLVRHTPTYSPPVASRSFAYLGVTLHEIVASRSSSLQTLAGQLQGFNGVPQPDPNQTYDMAAIVQGSLSSAVPKLFANTGPSGQRAMDLTQKKIQKELEARVDKNVLARSLDYGASVAEAVYQWSLNDGGANIENMGFPYSYPKASKASDWVPTNVIVQQQAPLLPKWGQNRTFALTSAKQCKLAAPPAFSSDKSSAFYKEALEVYNSTRALTPEQKLIARFWSDDPMLSPTPPGHWISILLQLTENDSNLEQFSESYARLGIALADSFIACWDTKYQYNLLRPITYLQKNIDPKWTPLLNTPPFPEFPSGHSTQSGAAATVLSAIFGEKYAFTDRTHEADGLKARTYKSFWAAAQEAGISRLYGGIHFRSAIDRGLEQGKCVGAKVNALKFRK
jgi:membrane-associated phospholipid phosphatase